MNDKATAQAAVQAAVMVSYRFMTYDELAALMGTSWRRVHQLVRDNNWRWHKDLAGGRRVSVPETFVRETRAGGFQAGLDDGRGLPPDA
ncbi:MAG: hypothetical protein JWN93_3055 [Hyphomicrobiales bacterium]|nr:hypothetical protein [Hyphomicrobiales bacterium]